MIRIWYQDGSYMDQFLTEEAIWGYIEDPECAGWEFLDDHPWNYRDRNNRGV